MSIERSVKASMENRPTFKRRMWKQFNWISQMKEHEPIAMYGKNNISKLYIPLDSSLTD